MTAKLSIILALVVSQATAFFVADNNAKALGPLASTYNRNYETPDMFRQNEGRFLISFLQ